MKLFMIFILLFVCGQAQANDVSLIEEGVVVTPVLKQLPVINEQEVDDNKGQEDEFAQMDSFIKKENEKLKAIKLLNLDIERADLELKKREIEQKMVQLNVREGVSSTVKQEEGDEAKINKPILRLAAVLESNAKRQAILNFDGRHINVKEGQEVEGVLVKTIKTQGITIQYQDGQTKELSL
jgi:hypothetical protein